MTSIWIYFIRLIRSERTFIVSKQDAGIPTNQFPEIADTNLFCHFTGDLKRSMDLRQSPPKELPSKMLKYKHMKERQQMLAAESGENDVNKKCAGTQT